MPGGQNVKPTVAPGEATVIWSELIVRTTQTSTWRRFTEKGYNLFPITLKRKLANQSDSCFWSHGQNCYIKLRLAGAHIRLICKATANGIERSRLLSEWFCIFTCPVCQGFFHIVGLISWWKSQGCVSTVVHWMFFCRLTLWWRLPALRWTLLSLWDGNSQELAGGRKLLCGSEWTPGQHPQPRNRQLSDRCDRRPLLLHS